MVQTYSLSLSLALSLSIRMHTESAFFHLATTLEKPQLGGRRYMER